MKIIQFKDYAIVILNRDFPVIKNRRELLEFMNGDMTANILWTDYIKWHCGLNLRPVKRRTMTFRAWLLQLDRSACTHSEWAFVADVQRDRQFPKGSLDKMTEYLLRVDAPDSTLDSLESLWIKYHMET